MVGIVFNNVEWSIELIQVDWTNLETNETGSETYPVDDIRGAIAEFLQTKDNPDIYDCNAYFVGDEEPSWYDDDEDYEDFAHD